MKYFIIVFGLFLFTSCFKFNGRITIQNDNLSNLKIETNPIITSGSGDWENGIHYYNKDSIIWTYTLGNNIKAKIIQPNFWKRQDSTFAQTSERGYHFGDYFLYRHDTAVNGIYAMYPSSSFTIGEFNTNKKIIPSQDNLNGKFTIRKLIIYNDNDTLIARGDKEIWNLLLKLDKNKENYNKAGNRKKIRHWIVSIKN
ncbi:hypothetical protein [Ferruginibacter sp.]